MARKKTTPVDETAPSPARMVLVEYDPGADGPALLNGRAVNPGARAWVPRHAFDAAGESAPGKFKILKEG